MVSYLQVEGLVKSFGDRVLFENLSLGVGEGQRIGLIAKNGTGKTTLLNIIAGREDYEAGRITFRRDLKVAYLEQNPAFPEGTTVLDACFLADSPALRAVAAYEQAVASADEDVLHRAMAEMDAQDAWNYESRVKQILTQLKIKDFDQPTGQLSGGQVKRVALANALIAEPDLLILDEPTNHLDLEMTEWLEEYLAHTRLSLLMVTHDRYFLDRVCSDIVEIDDRQAYVYHGNYSLYLEKRQQRLDAADAQRERDNNLYRTELEWIRRQPQARGTKARSRVESFGELEERLRKRRESGNVRLDVKAAYIGKKIFEVRGLSKRFGDKVILDGFDYRFARYEKMGIVGDNGTGKSTFIKMLMGLVQPDAGTIDIGETVRFGYYSQDGLSFDDGAKVIDVVTEIAEHIELGEGRRLSASQFLQYFLFTAQTQYDYVEKLSGGERRRLYLCTVLMRNPNFLVLDEPTNDLDIMTLQVLEEFLQGYGGCLIVISHDRYFMDKVADHLLVFQGGGQIKDFPGNYSDYLEWKRLKESEERAAGSQENKKIQEKQMPKQSSAPSGKRKRTYQENREMERLEQEIPQLEQEKAELERLLGSGSLSVGELTAKSVRIGEVIALIDEKSMRWLELSEIAG
ncbi:ATP-binding cassette domain-containing protein [Alistipes sp. dk3620]|uniref:ABC-F family ATP-binding cassette domain-containing protein n=1 Tax=Alistipes sp. dk3620 TaxID=2662432 RepID=UPI001296CB3F|nr:MULTISPECIES: ABC-F family ATP-binding cassette domain-containing protein [unclassified Alistipes]MQX26202.1 ATP-binding cassette domain-containing protein [Alistipes sp. dk3620]QGA23639.1 ATP-binding cassette domain-containing protein [Alistipes sp. dk3624]HIV60576.1 ABC-F family ATP-binding cassette domain-containing protein [Candidatus Alistipes pullistercoris]